MSPLRKKAPKLPLQRAKPTFQDRTVKASSRSKMFSGSSVTVKVTGEGPYQIRVDWLCGGGGRTFTADSLEKAIKWVDSIGTQYEPLWLHLEPLPGEYGYRKFYVKVQGGKLTANEDNTDNGFVSWANLRKACLATIKDVRQAEAKA